MGLKVKIVNIRWDDEYDGDYELPDLVDITNDYLGRFGSFKHKENLKKSVEDMLDEIEDFFFVYCVKRFGVEPHNWNVEMIC